MSELDLIKEKIGYYKVWLGIMVITDISLVGWLVGNYASASLMIVGGCILSIYLITGGIAFIHWRIGRHIEKLRNL